MSCFLSRSSIGAKFDEIEQKKAAAFLRHGHQKSRWKAAGSNLIIAGFRDAKVPSFSKALSRKPRGKALARAVNRQRRLHCECEVNSRFGCAF
ncbi:MAG: hypothetical protein F4Z30_13930 [Gemmatimonadetes bacterium]|nr:hypothetical protein [Gemmatimonadota bacterium]